jgi:hypothetical protein
MAAILSVGMLGLGVLASAKLDVQAQPVSGSDFDAFPIEAPAEPTVASGSHSDVIFGTCWFGQSRLGSGKCRSTFTICPKKDPATDCTGWLWINCNERYVYIGPQATVIAGANLTGVVGIPFAKYAFIPIVSLYFTHGTPHGGVPALLYEGHIRANHVGACIIFNPSGSQIRSTSELKEAMVSR